MCCDLAHSIFEILETVQKERVQNGSVATFDVGRERSTEGRGSVSGRRLEQPGDKSCLGFDVVAADLPNLPLPDHRHCLVARQRSSRRPEAAKAEARIDQAFHVAVVLLDSLIANDKTEPVRWLGSSAS